MSAPKKRTTKAQSSELRRLLAAATKVVAEIDRLALICDGVDELRAAIRDGEGVGT